MNIISSKTLENIQNRYKFVLNSFEEVRRVNDDFVGEVLVSFEDYHFTTRIQNLRIHIQKIEPKLDKDKKKFYISILDDIESKIAKVNGEMISQHFETDCFFFNLKHNYEVNMDKQFTLDTYIKISKDILESAAIKYINQEKKFINYNDTLNGIFNKLSNI